MRLFLALGLTILWVNCAFAGAGTGSANAIVSGKPATTGFSSSTALRASVPDWPAQTNSDRIFARADYNMEIALEPDRASAYFYRGQAERRHGNLVGAEADTTLAARLDPSLATNAASEFVALGYLRYQLQDLTNALSDFSRACELNPPDGQAHLAMWLCNSRLCDVQIANFQLQSYLAKDSAEATNAWTAEVARFLMGKVPEADFLNAAKADGDKSQAHYCEACFFTASKHLVSGDKTAATAYFKECLSTRLQHSDEYKAAKAELRRLAH
ncbi:MAG TPA: hypothetical protein VH280_05095 [Verrucomicrobiae bacterium]|jgi:lipoprotein NlpI|nr:hypothetical protein [Verrucomicrobiae bacterium]